MLSALLSISDKDQFPVTGAYHEPIDDGVAIVFFVIVELTGSRPPVQSFITDDGKNDERSVK